MNEKDIHNLENVNYGTFEQVSDLVSRIFPPGIDNDYTDNQHRTHRHWDGELTNVDLDSEIASQTGVGEKVRISIQGDEKQGRFSFIFRSRNPLASERYAVYIQKNPASELDDYVVSAGPLKLEKETSKRRFSPARIGEAVLGLSDFNIRDHYTEEYLSGQLKTAEPCMPEVTQSLFSSLENVVAQIEKLA